MLASLPVARWSPPAFRVIVLPPPSSEIVDESTSLLRMSKQKSCIFPVTLGRPLPSSYTLAITVAKEMLRPVDRFRPGSLPFSAAITVPKGVEILPTGLVQSASSSLPHLRAGGWGAIPPRTQGFATRKTGVPQGKIWGLSARGKQGEGSDAGGAKAMCPLQVLTFWVGKG